MTAAAIRRGAAPQRKPVKAKRGPGPIARALAAIPINTRLVERVVMWSIALILVGGAVAVALMLDVPSRMYQSFGETAGRAGLQVKQIDVRGLEHMDRLDVYAVALDQQSIAMPLVDLDAVREKLLAYGWVEDARVSRRLPDTLVVDIVERKPAAVWQHAQELTLIDREGVVLAPVKLDRMPDLPLLIGPDANTQAVALTTLMDHAPQLRPVLDGAVWVGGRRWNLRFQSGETLMLPEGEAAGAAALRKFAELDGQQRLLGQGMARFDMRLPGQMAVLPGAKKEPSAQGKPVDPALAT